MLTYAQLKARFPKASAAFLEANGITAPPERQKPVKRKETGNAKVPRTRNMGTWTESQFWGRIRSCLRRMSIYWRPAKEAELAARIPFAGPRGQKWAYRCTSCQELFPRRRVQLDHIIPCGTLRDYEHIGPFLQRLLQEEPAAYQVVCKTCHQRKTNEEREAATEQSHHEQPNKVEE